MHITKQKQKCSLILEKEYFLYTVLYQILKYVFF